MQFRNFSIDVEVRDDEILLVALIGTNKVSKTVARDASEETNYKDAAWSFKETVDGLPPNSTSPPCYLTQRGKWVRVTDNSTITSSIATVRVPSGNSGKLNLLYDGGSGAMTYQIDSGSAVAFTDGTQITVTDGQTLTFEVTGLGEQEAASGAVVDDDTEVLVDGYSLMNSTPIPA